MSDGSRANAGKHVLLLEARSRLAQNRERRLRSNATLAMLALIVHQVSLDTATSLRSSNGADTCIIEFAGRSHGLQPRADGSG
jgi:hypothetical protein